jgi:hypothetical protein
VFSTKRHPGDDALVRWYMADRGLGALDPKDESVVRHVSGCVRCTSRYESVSASLDDAAKAAVEAADATFTPERLHAQRERIMRRLDTAGARVLPFPAADAASGRPASSRPMLRWVALAAAAGLLIGIATGRLLQPTTPGAAPATIVAARTAPQIGAQVRPAALKVPADDPFLSEVESALSAPRTPELEPIDVMTLQMTTVPPGK